MPGPVEQQHNCWLIFDEIVFDSRTDDSLPASVKESSRYAIEQDEMIAKPIL
ncbi:MAG: hypothetical protein WBA89_24310 [Microcoleus sp.]|uniref:hypothetical protein n=1 Tax=Microcoleus sp. TaxID=44472 RepID=UPI003C793CD0